MWQKRTEWYHQGDLMFETYLFILEMQGGVVGVVNCLSNIPASRYFQNACRETLIW